MKPDRFTRIARKATDIEAFVSYADESWIPESKVAQLLRREHAWFRRMVKQELLPEHPNISQKVIGWNQAVQCIVEKLEQRRK